MLTDFNLYVEAFSNFLVTTDNTNATGEKKKALLKAVCGPDMVYLFKFIGKVAEDTTYEAVIMTIRGGIIEQTNQ